MFGLGIEPSSHRATRVDPRPSTLDPDDAVWGRERGGEHAGGAVRVDPPHVHPVEGPPDGAAQPVAHPAGVASDLEALEPDPAGAFRARVKLIGHLPLHEERELRVGLEPPNADLPPAQLDPVGAVPVALHGLPAEALLDL